MGFKNRLTLNIADGTFLLVNILNRKTNEQFTTKPAIAANGC
jgi:hypothetical protein